MFDNNYITTNRVISNPANISVRELRAPADDSVRLLMELETKAERNIIDRIVIEGNTVTGVVVMTEDHLANAKVIHVRFVLNGKDYYSKEVVHRSELLDKSKAIYKLLDRASKAILQELILETEHSGLEEI